MDKIMNTFKAANPDFVSPYKNARVINDPKQTKKAPAAPDVSPHNIPLFTSSV
jgi:hypothetical protein